MKHLLYIFNPEHDLALANDDLNFNPPLSALQLARDLEYLPVWYSEPGSFIYCRSGGNIDWLKNLQEIFPQISTSQLLQDVSSHEIADITPWGWDKSIKKQFSILDKNTSHFLPNEISLAKIKELSHRRTSIEALGFLRGQIQSDLLPDPPRELTEMVQIENFSKQYGSVIFKAPWSGSGKGLSWVRSGMTDSHRGWCKRIIEKQGSVIAEQVYQVQQNFAMLFGCSDSKCSFSGYSLFETEKGIYRSNYLLSNEEIFSRICADFNHPELLLSVQKSLLQFINSNIAPFYTGMLGVDMFLYKDGEKQKLHPCVEINLRMTMGCVARIFFDRFVHPNATGHFFVDHFPAKHVLWEDHLKRSGELQLHVEGGKIQSGYLSLSPVLPHSHYRIRVEIK